ncbi:hypothetical protein CONPUDRAFT_145787 [Coniophora puteana RWD-64-598 SS2]|uniref:Uncharacterized protein n=1 Tax=Coniophora puteana (strain RWD-64-598) TaxID=741705 RepID=A0A5M3MHC9_CONPW|nr:uncharacterized protein CONPUDRAFT_145787 [Coniophora puteana RWD-64-598 SS2]EIW78639.1 hypothetical protein CONPUDRAFT_145787 [Coniophora puteana RWD-64-598 SS2]
MPSEAFHNFVRTLWAWIKWLFLACFCATDEPCPGSNIETERPFDAAPDMENGSKNFRSPVTRPPHCSPHLASSPIFAYARSGNFSPTTLVRPTFVSPHPPRTSSLSPGPVAPIAPQYYTVYHSPERSVTPHPTPSATAMSDLSITSTPTPSITTSPSPSTTSTPMLSTTTASTPSTSIATTPASIARSCTVSSQSASTAEPITPCNVPELAIHIVSDTSKPPTVCNTGDIGAGTELPSALALPQPANAFGSHRRTSSVESDKAALGRPLSYLAWLWNDTDDGSPKRGEREQGQEHKHSSDAAGNLEAESSPPASAVCDTDQRSESDTISTPPSSPSRAPHTPVESPTCTYKRWALLDCASTLPSPAPFASPPHHDAGLPSPWSANELAKDSESESEAASASPSQCQWPMHEQSPSRERSRKRLVSPWSVYVVQDGLGDGGAKEGKGLGISLNERCSFVCAPGIAQEAGLCGPCVGFCFFSL